VSDRVAGPTQASCNSLRDEGEAAVVRALRPVAAESPYAMRKTVIAAFLIGGLLGVPVGIGVGFYIFPFVFPPAEATETLAAEEVAATIATGTFIHANPSDPVHYGRGRVRVTEQSVFLESDFEVGPGPAYRVYLVTADGVRTASDVTESEHISLGTLRAFKGGQRYAIPAGTDLSRYKSVVIWCEQFSVLISPADLVPA
jgi:hypothetical protein